MTPAEAAARRIVARHKGAILTCANCGCRKTTHTRAGRCRLDGDTCPGFKLFVPDDLLLARSVLALLERVGG